MNQASTKSDTLNVMEPLKRLPARFYRSDAGREPAREWLKPAARGVFLAYREAIGPLDQPRSLGSTKQSDRRKNCSGSILHGEELYGAVASIYQDHPEDTEE